jgi:hypothetical protein
MSGSSLQPIWLRGKMQGGDVTAPVLTRHTAWPKTFHDAQAALSSSVLVKHSSWRMPEWSWEPCWLPQPSGASGPLRCLQTGVAP